MEQKNNQTAEEPILSTKGLRSPKGFIKSFFPICGLIFLFSFMATANINNIFMKIFIALYGIIMLFYIIKSALDIRKSYVELYEDRIVGVTLPNNLLPSGKEQKKIGGKSFSLSYNDITSVSMYNEGTVSLQVGFGEVQYLVQAFNCAQDVIDIVKEQKEKASTCKDQTQINASIKAPFTTEHFGYAERKKRTKKKQLIATLITVAIIYLGLGIADALGLFVMGDYYYYDEGKYSENQVIAVEFNGTLGGEEGGSYMLYGNYFLSSDGHIGTIRNGVIKTEGFSRDHYYCRKGQEPEDFEKKGVFYYIRIIVSPVSKFVSETVNDSLLPLL